MTPRRRGSGIQAPLPLEVLGGDPVFHSAHAAVQVGKPPCEITKSAAAVADIIIVEVPLEFVFQRDDRRRFHEQAADKIENDNGPYTGEKEKYDGEEAHPPHAYRRIVGQSSAHPAYDTVPGTVKPSTCIIIVPSHYFSFL